MTLETVNAQVREGPAVSFEYDFGSTPEETNEIFGADIAHSFARRGIIIAAQGYARGLLKSGKSVEEVQEAFKTWKPGEPRAKMSPEERLKAEWMKMSPEDRERMLRELTGEAAPAPHQRAKRNAA